MRRQRLRYSKHSFILLEILIAISLVSILASYLIYQPFKELREELNLIASLEEKRIWEGKIRELEADLRQNCALLPKEEKNATAVSLSFNISLPHLEKKCIRTYKAWTRYKANADNQTEHFLIYVKVKEGKKFPSKSTYTFYHTQKSANPSLQPLSHLESD